MTSFSQPTFRLVFQLLFWLLLLGCFSALFLVLGVPDNNLLWRIAFMFVGIAALLSLNIYVLFPRYLAIGRYRMYLIITLSVCLLIVLISMAIDVIIWEHTPAVEQFKFMPFMKRARALFYLPPIFLKSLFFFFAITSSSLVEHIYLQQKNERLAAKVKAEGAATELAFLKSQINPHFLLNALNNIYGLSIRPDGDNSEVVLQLSEMLRYVLYECNKLVVPVAAEINYIQHYIALQQLKDAGRFNVRCRYPVSTHDYHIAPMLLIPLVENAFKHSQIENLDEGWIEIEIRIMEERTLCVQIQNSVLPRKSTSEAPGGIGIKNVQRRLELLYSEQYSLQIEDKKDTFKIKLTVHLLNQPASLLQPS